jgi:hypothetical protein
MGYGSKSPPSLLVEPQMLGIVPPKQKRMPEDDLENEHTISQGVSLRFWGIRKENVY